VGDTDIGRQLDAGSSQSGVRLRGSLIAGYQTGDKTYHLTEQVPTPGGVYDLRVALLTLVAGADLWTGTGAGIVLPWGAIYRRDSEHQGTDVSLGDLEVRVRQELTTLFGWTGRYLPRITLSTGFVAPTGPYIGKVTAVLNGDTPPTVADSRYSSLGRGVWWLVGDVDLFGRISEQFGWFVSVWTRWPQGEASNGFIWGSEQRLSFGSAWRIWPEHLAAALSVDWQMRQKASEVLPDVLTQSYVRSEFLNGGGDWIDLSPSLRWDVAQDWALTAVVHQPVYRNVVGVQGVTNTAVFLGVSWSQTLGTAPKPAHPDFEIGQRPVAEMAEKLAPGRVTILDYWATWCEPCQRLSAELETFARARPDVTVVRVDATEWLQPEMDKFLPGCAGLPVLDVYDKAGKLLMRLMGPDAFGYGAHVPLPEGVSATLADAADRRE
jgi:thiol-disulfide isomerase/thioredoxin